MAVLSTNDYQQMRQYLYRKGFGKEDLHLLAGLPTKAQLLGAFQAVEDNNQASRTVIKNAIDAAIGFATSVSLAKKIYQAYVNVKGV